MTNGKPFFGILALDGGGIRGIIPASVLISLEKLIGGPIAQTFDLIVGTSTGGLIALGLVQPGTGSQPKYSPQDLLSFYTDRDNDARIFTKWYGGNTGGKPVDWVDALTHPKYSGSGVNDFLTDKFGTTTLADAIAPVSCVSYQISGTPTPFFFRSWQASQPGQNFSTVHAGRATSAAPLYFPPVQITSTDNSFTGTFVDGGGTANDPAIVAFAEAGQYLAAQGKNIDDYNVWLLSIGTGQATLSIDPGDGGIWGWLRHDALPTTLLNGPEQIADIIAQSLFQPADGLFYGRIQVPLQGTTQSGKSYSAAPELDDWTQENIDNLLLAGEAAGGSGSSLLASTVRNLARREKG